MAGPVVCCVADSVVLVEVSSQLLSVICEDVSVDDEVGTPGTLGVGVTGVLVLVLVLDEVVGTTGLLVE